MQRITNIVNRSRGGKSLMRPINNGGNKSLFYQTRRRVSMQCWDAFGNLRDGTDLVKRDAAGWVMYYHPFFWKSFLFTIHFAPMVFVLWANGVFDYLTRRRKIKPLEPNLSGGGAYVYRSPDPDYENPLFEPARKHAKVLERKQARREYQWQKMQEIIQVYDKQGLSAALSSGIRADDFVYKENE